MAAGREKANIWNGRGNNGGSWPPAFPRSPNMRSMHSMGRHFNLYQAFKPLGFLGYIQNASVRCMERWLFVNKLKLMIAVGQITSHLYNIAKKDLAVKN